MFKVVQRELSSWNHCRFITTVITHSLRDNAGEITATRPNSTGPCIRKFSTQSREMVKARKYVVVNHFVGEAKSTDLKLVEEELPPLQNGEYLVEAEYLSVDPYMRPYVQRFPRGITMIGSQVAKIIESKNPDFPVGKRIVGSLGWRTHTIVNPAVKDATQILPTYILPDIGDLPSSLALGVLGMPGNTAYFGLLEICKPKSGETIVISGAAGAVGSHVGQIAKDLGMTVIGLCGSDEKCKWLTEELGFDSAINYKTMPVAASLRKAAPQGVDCYFDNVGGDISGVVMYQMRPFGRIAVCGSISSYDANPSSLPKSTILQPVMVYNEMKMEGFIVTRWADRWHEGIMHNLQLIRKGKLRYRETVTKGFENMFDAFIGMLRGKNVGKAIVQA
ncbi:PREDICTED: prostaglandin reductase 1-like isoform X2 [Wasmannia auropunctata]|uniref:prostaglandin reductase 1-like isoform X2 n=1 Tax=Wasmannia auropunctata TaxID=64793 RepID=UPI0005F05C5C|nr:PREDICTED: prostaglandin reductase 1-like isoform X2 [Wasmannia auropunctata]